ncbi:hypothetical protein ABGB18_03690 [Nonomuraea sp. B12E4]|uniref:hypothetical protein n=1 Tax=Nonomuraea sp. B12E4 TaxID=3153564 RepID=UPI00325D8C3D
MGLAHGAFDLLLESAARAADDHGAQAIALAQAVVTARRFTSGFPGPIPHLRLRALLDQATTIVDPATAGTAHGGLTVSGTVDDGGLVAGGSTGGDRLYRAAAGGLVVGGKGVEGAGGGVVDAHPAAASAWCARSPQVSPDPVLAEAAVAAARVTGDPVIISAAMDATGTLAIRAGRFRTAYRIARERLALVEAMDRRHPASAAEILDSFHNAWLCAFAAGDLLAALSTAELIAGDAHGSWSREPWTSWRSWRPWLAGPFPGLPPGGLPPMHAPPGPSWPC